MENKEFSFEQREAFLNGDYNNNVLTELKEFPKELGGNGELVEGVFELIDYEQFNEIFPNGKMRVNEANATAEYICETLDDYYPDVYYIISEDRETVLEELAMYIEDNADFNIGGYDLFKLNNLYISLS